MEKIRNWVKDFFGVYNIDDLRIGGNCGICGEWMPDEIFPAAWRWGLCNKH